MFTYSAFGEMTLSAQEILMLKMLKMAEKFGWTLDYIKNMDIHEFNRVGQMLAGEAQAVSYIRRNPKAFGLGE